MIDLEDTLQRMCREHGRESTYRRIQRFILAYLGLFDLDLPTIASQAIAELSIFLEGKTDGQALEQSRIQCWQYLHENGRSNDFLDRETCFIRALICGLYKNSPDEDLFECISWAITLANRAVDKSDQLQSKISEYFSES